MKNKYKIQYSGIILDIYNIIFIFWTMDRSVDNYKR